jgi:hydrogenase maturation protease
MTHGSVRCLILACGNTLREDDGVGPWIGAWAEARFRNDDRVSVISRHQWTPELAFDIWEADSVLFIDCAASSTPGQVRIAPVTLGRETSGLDTHHVDGATLLSLSNELYGSLPRTALQLTIGAGSLKLREGFSEAVMSTLSEACRLLEDTVLDLVSASDQRK